MRRLNERNEDFQSSLVRLKDKAILSNFPKKLTDRIITTASSWDSRFPPDSTTPANSKSPGLVYSSSEFAKTVRTSARVETFRSGHLQKARQFVYTADPFQKTLPPNNIC